MVAIVSSSANFVDNLAADIGRSRYYATVHIAYCTNVRLPSERAHGHQIAQVCEALQSLEHAVELFAPKRVSQITEDFQTYYNLPEPIPITYLQAFDHNAFPLPLGVLGLWLDNFVLRRAYRRALRQHQFDLLYTRAPALVPALLKAGAPVALELHQLPTRNRSRFVADCNRCQLVICLTSPMRDQLVAWGVEESKLLVEGDAVDLQRFVALPSHTEARQQLQCATERVVVGYVGRLKTVGMEKGVADLLQALALSKDQRRFFGLIVGGPEDDCVEYRQLATSLGLTADDVQFTGAVPAAKVPTALAACDVLAMPWPDLPHYRTNMSPLKMFEYMAAERVILTADLPTVRDVLSEETAVFCEAGNVQSIANALWWIVDHEAEAAARAQRARHVVGDYTWEKRMARILSTFDQ